MAIREKPHTCCPKGQLEHQCNPGQQPGAEVPGEHRPIERASAPTTCVHALLVGELGLSSFVRKLGFTLVQLSLRLERINREYKSKETRI